MTVPIRTTRRRAAPTVRYVLLGLFSIPWIFLPFWILIVNSFKSQGDASVLTIDLPKVWNVAQNYSTVIRDGSYLTGLANSLLIAVPTIVLVLLLGTMAAWSYARSPSRSLRLAYYMSALSIILPPAIIPTVFVLTQLGINGTRPGYLLALIGTRLGIAIFLTTGYIRTLPIDFEEAAQLDGANRWQVYWHLILPLLRPLLFTAAVMLILSVWNDFFMALFLLDSADKATLPLTLYQFAGAGADNGLRWNLVFAHVVLSSLPLFIAYLLLQKRVVSGLTDGGVTG